MNLPETQGEDSLDAPHTDLVRNNILRNLTTRLTALAPDIQTQADIDLKTEEVARAKAQNALIEQEVDGKKARNESRRNDTELRKGFSNKIFGFLVGWTSFVAVFLTLTGLEILKVESEILLTLLGSTTVSIVGIFMAVANYLFPNKGKNRDSKDKEG